jgi:hypothetical protein
MNTVELHIKLKEAYSNQNLNKITVTLINLYKDKQFGTLRQIAEMISEAVPIDIDPEAKYFSRLMMLYHPDRGDFHRNEIERLAADKDHDGLLGFAHILLLGRIEEIAASLASYEDIDYSPVYEWDVNLDGFNIVTDRDPFEAEKKQYPNRKRKGLSFYNALKMRMYGKTTVGFPSHYLEDFEEMELAQSDINDLDGVQYCIHTLVMDLSGNAISDISLLWGLTQLEELNLADNKLEDIDSLANLRNLRTVNLSNNNIKDLSPLLNLNKLEFADLTGLKVSKNHLAELEELGITVVI